MMWFDLILTTECNWNCGYCSIDRVENKYVTLETINKHLYVFDILNKINPKNIVVLGGEIGLIKSNELLKNIFERFNQKVIINTNGLFFQTDRRMLYPYIQEVFYHTAPDAKSLIKINPLKNLPFKVTYGIVDDNDEDLQKFIEFNSHIMFEYVEKEYSDFNYELFQLNKENIKKCNILNPFTTIDLSREVLCMCASKGSHITIPLTRSNLINVLCGFFNFKEENDMCMNCYRLCKNQDFNYTYKQKIEIRKLLF